MYHDDIALCVIMSVTDEWVERVWERRRP